MQPQPGRSLPWFRVDVDLVDHPKVFALADALGVSDNEALAIVVRLWAWTMRYAARGRLAPGARTALGRACGGRGMSVDLVEVLVRTGWLDDLGQGELEVHDWSEHNGAAVAKAEKDSERKRAARARRGDGAETARAGRADGAGNGTGRDGTGHITTLSSELDLVPTESPDERRPAERLEAKLTDDEFQVWAHWKAVLRHPKAVATEARRKLIARWLPLYGVERLQRAISGCAKSPHHMGQNDRRTVYDSIELILRDSAHIESFERLAEGS